MANLITQLQQENSCLGLELAQLRQENDRLVMQYESLRQSELRHRQIFENAPISMLSINTDGYITRMNAAAENLFGLTIDQLNEQACPIFSNPQLVENGTLPYMQRAFAGEAVIEPPTTYDASRDLAGGKLHYGRGHYVPIRNAHGAVEEIVEINANYSDFFALQKKLLAEKDRAAQERAQLLSTIAEVANLLLKSSDYTTVLPDVVRLLGEAVGSDRCSIVQDITHPTLRKPAVQIPAEWCKVDVSASAVCTPQLQSALLWEDMGGLYEQFLAAEVIDFLVADLPEPTRSIFEAQRNTSMLAVPIVVKDQPWGLVSFDNCESSHLFDQAEIAILKIAADSIAAAIERQAKDEELLQIEQARTQSAAERSQELETINAALQTEVTERRRAEQVSRGQTEALVKTLTTLALEPVLDNCLGYMLQAIADQLNDRSAGIYLYSEVYDTTLLHLNYENGQIQRSKEICHPCARTPNPLRQWDDQYMPLLKQRQILIQDVAHYSHNLDRGIKQILVVPLLFGDTFLGNITLRSTKYRQYQPEELELVQALTHQATLAIQLMQLAKQGQHEAKQAAILEERNRLAREIHDTLAQCLTGIIVQLQAATDDYTTNLWDQKAHLSQAIALAKNGLHEARRSVRALRPRSLETEPLEAALEHLTEQMAIGTSLETNYRLVGIPYSLTPSIEDHLLRIAQEAFTNVLRHANANQVEIELDYQLNQIYLHIKDNGQGFDANTSLASGYGLIGMQERADQMAAQLIIVSDPQQGTCIQITVPILPQ
ncbi:GAF domain-containing protein [Phormidesmis sp. 146-33]